MKSLFVQIALPSLALVFVVAVLALPLIRLYRRHRIWGLVIRKRGPIEATVGVWAVLLLTAVGVWIAVYSLSGDMGMGLWAVHGSFQVVGLLLIVSSVVLVVVAQAQMGASWRIGIEQERTELVQRGVFGVVRNPIYTGILGTILGLWLATPSAWTTAALLLTCVLLSIQARLEEQHLLRTHGQAYTEYAVRVGRFVPGLGKLRAE